MIAALALLAIAAAADPGNLCTLCHPDVRVAFEKSIHSSERVPCTSCHGGDSTASTVEGAHRGRFDPATDRRAVPALCGSCHSDVERMRPYNLPTDQLALYQTSSHGRALAEGDTSVAVCVDCHGVHEILAADDPRSPVSLRNIAGTCGRCHADDATNPLEAYAGSVHGLAVAREGNPSAPSCSRCHGTHGAAPPGVGDIEKVCGQCHATTRAYFLESPHKMAMDEAGLGECIACHDHHRVERASIDMLGTVCLQCHDDASEQVEMASQMMTLYTGAAEALDAARALVEKAGEVPLYIDDYTARLTEAHTFLLESLPAMHSLDLSHVESLTQRARSIGHEVSSEVGGKLDGRKWRRVGLLLFWFYLILTLALLGRFRARAARDSRS